MNIDKLYHIEHFDSYNNIYVIYKKHIQLHKRINSLDEFLEEELSNYEIYNNDNKYYILITDKIKYIPVYGHYYNNSNNFFCKKLIGKNVSDVNNPHNFLIIEDSDIVRAENGGIFKSNNIDDIYDIIDKLKTGELKNGTA